ncbi:MAG TPA: hypothetical protein VHW46_03765 [Terracidiphilus sp.]|jgi:hypothetical protein|nr:hypothetical protein [Terracidiphilus sp.]
MSNEQDGRKDDRSSRGPNLTLLFTLIGVALVIAMGIAVLIVLPFYRHH